MYISQSTCLYYVTKKAPVNICYGQYIYQIMYKYYIEYEFYNMYILQSTCLSYATKKAPVIIYIHVYVTTFVNLYIHSTVNVYIQYIYILVNINVYIQYIYIIVNMPALYHVYGKSVNVCLQLVDLECVLQCLLHCVLQCVSYMTVVSFSMCVWCVCSVSVRGGGLGSRPKKMYGERLGDGVEYHLMKPTPRR